MGMFDKKEGGTKVGNILRGLKNVGLPIAELADKLVLGGKASDLISLIKGDTITTDNKPLSPEVVESILLALNEDVQDARDHAENRDKDVNVPTLNKIAPVIIDLIITATFGGGFFLIVYLMFFKEAVTANTIIQAVLLFGQVQAILMVIVMFYRGGNSSEQHSFIGKLLGKK